jgi:hypothetical protein
MNNFFEKYKLPIRFFLIIAFAIFACVRWSNYAETKATRQLVGGFVWSAALVFGIIKLVEIVKEKNKTD